MQTPKLKRIVQTICEGLGFSNLELSIVITDDETIHELNRQWRNKDKPTDVLSFPQEEGKVDPLTFWGHLGDVVISAETAAKQAPLPACKKMDADTERAMVAMRGQVESILPINQWHIIPPNTIKKKVFLRPT